MNICFFGSYDPEYSRNKILIDGLKKNGCTIFYCNSKSGFFLQRYFELIKQYWPIQKNVDILYVAFVGQLNMPLAWFLGKLTRKKVVFDMYLSFYETYVFDRLVAKPKSLYGFQHFWIDKLSIILSDLIITDTQTHADYYMKTFKLTHLKKFSRIFVGGDDTLFKPIIKGKKDRIVIEFHGIFTKFQGAEYYIRAAKLLENRKNLKFILIGSPNNFDKPIRVLSRLHPKNLIYYPKLSVYELAKKISECDITIGHLGTTEKSRSVISNKIYQGISCGNALICGDSEAVRELFLDRDTVLFTKMGNEFDLAKKISELARDTRLRRRLSINGFTLAKTRLTNRILGKELLGLFRKIN